MTTATLGQAVPFTTRKGHVQAAFVLATPETITQPELPSEDDAAVLAKYGQTVKIHQPSIAPLGEDEVIVSAVSPASGRFHRPVRASFDADSATYREVENAA